MAKTVKQKSEGDKAKDKFKLPKDTLLAVPIKRMRRGTPVSHETSFKFKNSYEKLGIPVVNIGGRGKFANIFNSEEEREYLEEALGEDLNVNKLDNEFLSEFRVKLTGEVTSFDLSDPLDYLSVLVLKANKSIICTDPEERMNKATYMWILSKSGFQESEKEALGERKLDLYAFYKQIKDDKEALTSFLRQVGTRPAANADIGWLRGKVIEEIEANPTQSWIIIKDPDREYKEIFDQALDNRAIFYQADEGYIMRGRSIPFAVNKSEAINFLKDKKNQEVLMEIKALINTAKE